jgi:hypothetical protein
MVAAKFDESADRRRSSSPIRSAYPATICFSSTFSARSAAFCAASWSADGVSDTTTPSRAHRKINLPRRTKSKPVTIAPPEQLRHRDGEESPLHQARWCATSARIGFHHFVLAAEFLQLDLFGEFPLPRRSGRLASRTLAGDDNQFV